MFFEDIDESSEEAKQFDELIRSINEDCGGSKTIDRCDNALEFAKCSDRLLESFHLISNTLSSDELLEAAKSKEEIV